MVCCWAACLASRNACRASKGVEGGRFYPLSLVMGFERRSGMMSVSSTGLFILDFNFITQHHPKTIKLIIRSSLYCLLLYLHIRL